MKIIHTGICIQLDGVEDSFTCSICNVHDRFMLHFYRVFMRIELWGVKHTITQSRWSGESELTRQWRGGGAPDFSRRISWKYLYVANRRDTHKSREAIECRRVSVPVRIIQRGDHQESPLGMQTAASIPKQ